VAEGVSSTGVGVEATDATTELKALGVGLGEVEALGLAAVEVKADAVVIASSVKEPIASAATARTAVARTRIRRRGFGCAGSVVISPQSRRRSFSVAILRSTR
jgi:hypothetical protein